MKHEDLAFALATCLVLSATVAAAQSKRPIVTTHADSARLMGRSTNSGSRAAPTVHKAHASITSVSTSDQPVLYDPKANSRAIVSAGKARFTILTPQLIRMEWSSDGVFEDHASLVFVNRHLPVPSFQSAVADSPVGKVLTIDTGALKLRYKIGTNPDQGFDADNLEIGFMLEGKYTVWRPGQSTAGNLLGTARSLDQAQGDKLKEPIGLGILSRAGWALIDDSTTPLFDSVDFQFSQGEASPWPWAMARPAGKRQDWYFFGYGHQYRKALLDFTRVAGKIPLPPYFAFGLWRSRYWAYNDQQLLRLADEYRQNNIPLDVMVIDMDWHLTDQQDALKGQKDQSGEGLGWTGYTWNKILFPHPGMFLQQLHEDGLKVTLNLHPASGVEPWESRYPEMAKAMGIDPSTGKYIPFDIANKRFAQNYMEILHHPLEKQGVDFWWLDWQQENTTRLPGLNPVWWLNYVHFTDQAREGKRPLILSRWGGLGDHRYQVGFSGDTYSTWATLAFEPWFTATAANVGYAYWSHDMGGHMPGAISPELFTRWIQFGVFSPILRTHTSPNPAADRRIWAYPEPYAGIMRKAVDFRYSLLPYIYTEARRTYDTGVAFLHPLYYDWPEEPQAYAVKDEYMFGDQMLIAPVTDPVNPQSQLAVEDVWLPPGDWIEWQTGTRLKGPALLKRKYSIQQTPIFVRSGAIIPMDVPGENTEQSRSGPLVLTIFPTSSAEQRNYTLYEDSGTGTQYRRGAGAWTGIHAREINGNLILRVDAVKGSYADMPASRGLRVQLPDDWPPESITVNGRIVHYDATGKPASWKYDGNLLETILTLNSFPKNQPVTIVVHRTSDLVKRRAELNGFAGAMTRLEEAYDALNVWPLTWSPDKLAIALQAGDRISYAPDTCSAEIAKFPQELSIAESAVRGMRSALTEKDRESIAADASSPGASWIDRLQLQESHKYETYIDRALQFLQSISNASDYEAAVPGSMR